MKSLNATFNEAAKRSGKVPRYILAFADLDLTLTSFSDAAHPTRWPLILEVSGTSGSVKPDEGKSDVSSLTVKVMDDERFHMILPALVRDSRATLTAGFEGLPEADWPALFTGLIDDPKLDDQLGVWTLCLNDLKFWTVNSAFRTFGKTKLNGALAAGANHAHVDSTDGTATGDMAFHDPLTSETNGFLLIDSKEIVSYTGRDAPNYLQFTGLTRGLYAVAGGYADMNHADNATVQELFVLQGNPIDLLLKILTSTGAGTNGAYDVWESDQGLGIDQDLIDVAKYEFYRDTFMGGDVYRFLLKEPVKDVKTFLEAEIYRAINGYPLVTGDGFLSMKLFHFPYASDPDTLTEDEAIEVTGWARGFGNMINQTQIEYDWAPGPGEFLVQRYDVEAVLANKHGLTSPWKASFKGIYSDLQGEQTIDRRVLRLFGRYGEGAPNFSVKVFLEKFKWDPGDLVSVTLSRLIDAARGVRGVVSKLMEVVKFAPNFGEGTIGLDILDTSLGGRGAGIAPDGTPEYSAATEAEKGYGFICDSVSLKMPNGDEPYLIV